MGRKKTTGNYDTREELLEAVAQHRRDGKTQFQIAELVGVSEGTVKNILKELEDAS